MSLQTVLQVPLHRTDIISSRYSQPLCKKRHSLPCCSHFLLLCYHILQTDQHILFSHCFGKASSQHFTTLEKTCRYRKMPFSQACTLSRILDRPVIYILQSHLESHQFGLCHHLSIGHLRLEFEWTLGGQYLEVRGFLSATAWRFHTEIICSQYFVHHNSCHRLLIVHCTYLRSMQIPSHTALRDTSSYMTSDTDRYLAELIRRWHHCPG
jgi:hypothetical protein